MTEPTFCIYPWSEFYPIEEQSRNALEAAQFLLKKLPAITDCITSECFYLDRVRYKSWNALHRSKSVQLIRKLSKTARTLTKLNLPHLLCLFHGAFELEGQVHLPSANLVEKLITCLNELLSKALDLLTISLKSFCLCFKSINQGFFIPTFLLYVSSCSRIHFLTRGLLYLILSKYEAISAFNRCISSSSLIPSFFETLHSFTSTIIDSQDHSLLSLSAFVNRICLLSADIAQKSRNYTTSTSFARIDAINLLGTSSIVTHQKSHPTEIKQSRPDANMEDMGRVLNELEASKLRSNTIYRSTELGKVIQHSMNLLPLHSESPHSDKVDTFESPTRKQKLTKIKSLLKSLSDSIKSIEDREDVVKFQAGIFEKLVQKPKLYTLLCVKLRQKLKDKLNMFGFNVIVNKRHNPPIEFSEIQPGISETDENRQKIRKLLRKLIKNIDGITDNESAEKFKGKICLKLKEKPKLYTSLCRKLQSRIFNRFRAVGCTPDFLK